MNTQINDDIFNQFPVLETERLVLRAFKADDAQALFDIRSNEKVMKYMDTYSHESVNDSLQMIEGILSSFNEKAGINWAIEEKASGQFIGYLGFWRLMKEHVRGEIGYALNNKYWGKGFMGEAMKAALSFGFKELCMHSIEANVNINNQPSIVLLEKHGFVKEAHFRENYYYNGHFYDSIIYSLLENEV